MAVDSANIGANFSQYEGNPGLGGFGLTQGRVDTRALEDLARYTMLYNKAEYDQRQKDAEKAAEEIAKYSAIDLSTSIPKDAKILQEKFDSLSKFLRDNPDALNYKNRQLWLEYNKRKNDLNNDIKFATIRDVINVSRKNQIAQETNEEKKKFLQSQLQANIDATDIRTPLDIAQKYDIKIPEIPTNTGIKVDVTKAGSNEIFQRDYTMFDMQQADRAGAAFGLGIQALDPSTTTDKLKLMDVNENPWIKMKDRLNQAIAGATDANGVVDKSKLVGVPMMSNVELFNEYVKRTKDDIKNGLYNDKLGNKITFGKGPFREEDYQEIDLSNGLDERELAKVAAFSKWASDETKTKVIQTNDDLEKQRLAAEWARIGIAREQLNKSSKEDLVSATSVLREAADVLNGGESRIMKWNGGERKIKIISDPNMLKEFGTIDKDGTTANVPDAFYYDEAANKVSLVYYKRDENDPKKIIVGKNGEKLLDKPPVDFTGTQWLGQIVRRKNQNRDIGGVNSLIEQFFNAKGVDRKLKNINKIYGQTVEGTQGRSESESQSRTTPVSEEDGKLTDAQYYQKYKKFRQK